MRSHQTPGVFSQGENEGEVGVGVGCGLGWCSGACNGKEWLWWWWWWRESEEVGAKTQHRGGHHWFNTQLISLLLGRGAREKERGGYVCEKGW